VVGLFSLPHSCEGGGEVIEGGVLKGRYILEGVRKKGFKYTI
jgi:hypothetical protein